MPYLNPLVLSFRTPPAVRPQSILIGKMMAEWQRQGTNPVIITYDNNGDWTTNLDVYNIPQFRVSRYFNNRYINKIFPIKYWLEDLYYQKIFKITKKIIKKNQPNIVFSFSNPYASNILGAMIKKRLKIPFVAYFSDPWYDDPYQNFTYIEKVKIAHLEKFIVKYADKVIFCNQVARKLVMKKYPQEWFDKSDIVPHCFDPSDYPKPTQNPLTADHKFAISHIGAFYPERNPKPLFKALRIALEKSPELKTEIKLNLIGGASNYTGYKLNDLKNLLKSYKLDSITDIIPPVKYKQSLQYMVDSDLLVVIDANFEHSPFLTSKVIDYLGSGNPIIGITPNNSPTDNLLTQVGYKSFTYTEINQLANYLQTAIKNKTKIKPNQTAISQYDVQNTTKKLLKIFTQILSE